MVQPEQQNRTGKRPRPCSDWMTLWSLRAGVDAISQKNDAQMRPASCPPPDDSRSPIHIHRYVRPRCISANSGDTGYFGGELGRVMPARVRFKSFKVAPGIKFRVNAKSTGVTVGGKGVHHTVNSSGRRTVTVRVPGTLLSVQNVSGTRRTAPTRTSVPTPRPAASRAVAASKPGLFAPKGEKQLYQILATDG